MSTNPRIHLVLLPLLLGGCLPLACGSDTAPAAPADAPGASRDEAPAPPPDLTYPGEETGTALASTPPESPAEAVPPEPSVPPPLAQVRLFLVELDPGGGDGGEEAPGRPGDTFGCGDRLRGIAVPVATEGLDTAGRIGAALMSLLVAEGGEETPGDLYSALARSQLTVERVEPVTGVDGLFRVHLSGRLQLGGVCDNPRVRAQLEATARQFEGVEEVEFMVGGQPLEALLSGR